MEGRGSRGTGQRRRLEVGQCPRRCRLPGTPETATGSTHDLDTPLPSQGEPPLTGFPPLSWRLVVSPTTNNRCVRTGQVFLCKRPGRSGATADLHRHPGARLPGDGANGVFEACPEEALAVGDGRLTARLGDRHRLAAGRCRVGDAAVQ